MALDEIAARPEASFHDKMLATGWERFELYRKTGRALAPDGGPVDVACEVDAMVIEFADDPVGVAEAELAALVARVDGSESGERSHVDG